MTGGWIAWLRRLPARTSAPIAEGAWRKWRNRVALWSLGLGFVLALQTALVHSPDYVIGALYHERRVINLELQSLPPDRRAKLMERLCLAEMLFKQGGVDPYAIAEASRCSAGGAK